MCAETSFFEKNHHFAEIWKLNFVIHDINKKLKSILSWNPPNTFALWSKIPTRWSRKHFNSQSIVKIGLEAAFQAFRDTLKISSFSMFFLYFPIFQTASAEAQCRTKMSKIPSMWNLCPSPERAAPVSAVRAQFLNRIYLPASAATG